MSTDALASEISTLASELMLYEDSPLSRSLNYMDTRYEKGHEEMISGNYINSSMWHYLFDTLIRPKFPTVSLWWHQDEPYELEPGQTAYRLRFQHINPDRNCALPQLSWSIREFTGGSNVMKEYRLRKTHGDLSVEMQEILKGVPTWKMQVHVHQETPFDLPQRIAFEDALVFDMLLDLVTGNFEPHTKSINEGPAAQLEILRMLVKAQKEAVHAADTCAGKRKLSMQDRLDGKKRMKTE